MTFKFKSVVAGIALSLLSLTSHAGEFNEHDGVAIKGYDPVAFFKESKPVRGKDDLRFDYKGSTFIFATPTIVPHSLRIQRSMFRSTVVTAHSELHAATRPISILRRSLSSTAGFI